MPRGDRTGPTGRARKREAAGENAVLKAEAPHHRTKMVLVPERGKAGEQAKAPAGVRAKAEVPDRAKAGGLNTLRTSEKLEVN